VQKANEPEDEDSSEGGASLKKKEWEKVPNREKKWSS